MCRWTEYKALVELLQLSKPVGNKSQQKLIFALEGNRSDLLQTEQKWWERRWQFQLVPQSRVVAWELLALVLTHHSPNEKETKLKPRKMKDQLFLQLYARIQCPVKSNVRFCFRSLCLKAESDSPLTISGQIQRVCKEAMLFNWLYLYQDFIRMLCAHQVAITISLSEFVTENTHCSYTHCSLLLLGNSPAAWQLETAAAAASIPNFKYVEIWEKKNTVMWYITLLNTNTGFKHVSQLL